MTAIRAAVVQSRPFKARMFRPLNSEGTGYKVVWCKVLVRVTHRYIGSPAPVLQHPRWFSVAFILWASTIWTAHYRARCGINSWRSGLWWMSGWILKSPFVPFMSAGPLSSIRGVSYARRYLWQMETMRPCAQRTRFSQHNAGVEAFWSEELVQGLILYTHKASCALYVWFIVVFEKVAPQMGRIMSRHQ